MDDERGLSCVPVSGRDSLERCTSRGETPLFLAVERGLIENTSFLLERGAQPDSQDQELDSPLVVGKTTNISLPRSLESCCGR